jgi:hypothetical protein
MHSQRDVSDGSRYIQYADKKRKGFAYAKPFMDYYA